MISSCGSTMISSLIVCVVSLASVGPSERPPKTPEVLYNFLLLHDGLAHGFAEIVIVHLACRGLPTPHCDVLVFSMAVVHRQLREQRLRVADDARPLPPPVSLRAHRPDFISNMQKSK